MKFWVVHHQHKGKPYQEALIDAGWQYSRRPQIVLMDTSRSRKIIEAYSKYETTFVLYPHTAIAAWWYDGVMELQPEISAMLCIGEGQAEVQRIITPELPVYPVGWTYCPIKSFQPPKRVKRITFAPIHPSGTILRPEAKEINAKVFADLLTLRDTQIVVRIIGSLEANGLWYSPKVIYQNGKPNGDYSDIDISDLVIGEGMYMYLAVARGKPVIGLNQNLPIRVNNSLKEPANWKKYNHLQAYPIDYADGDIITNIDRALSQDEAVENWKHRFVGKQLDPKILVATLEKIYDAQHDKKQSIMGANQKRN